MDSTDSNLLRRQIDLQFAVLAAVIREIQHGTISSDVQVAVRLSSKWGELTVRMWCGGPQLRASQLAHSELGVGGIFDTPILEYGNERDVRPSRPEDVF